jgi:hypothetical protein
MRVTHHRNITFIAFLIFHHLKAQRRFKEDKMRLCSKASIVNDEIDFSEHYYISIFYII